MGNLSIVVKERDKSQEHVYIALKGKIKGESYERDHMFPCSQITSSGIRFCDWLRLLELGHDLAKREECPAITDWEGNILSMSAIDNMLHKFLIRLHERGESFHREIKSADGIMERFSVFRSLRRASTTRAMNQNVSSNDIDTINR